MGVQVSLISLALLGFTSALYITNPVTNYRSFPNIPVLRILSAQRLNTALTLVSVSTILSTSKLVALVQHMTTAQRLAILAGRNLCVEFGSSFQSSLVFYCSDTSK